MRPVEIFLTVTDCRHGGEEGVTCNVIAFDSKSDQACWATGIVTSTLGMWCGTTLLKYFYTAGTEIFPAAARRVKKWMSQVSYKGRSAELTVDYDEGFTLKDSQSGSIIFNKNFPGKDNFLFVRKRNILI